MKNIFKLKIPTNEQQTLDELESFTVMWKVRADIFKEWYIYHKVFTCTLEASEFEKQLRASADFIRAEIKTEKYKN